LTLGLSPLFSKTFIVATFSGQNFREQLLELGIASELGEMAHESCTNALAFLFVDHGEAISAASRRTTTYRTPPTIELRSPSRNSATRATWRTKSTSPKLRARPLSLLLGIERSEA
jgi:hypothetical protein